MGRTKRAFAIVAFTTLVSCSSHAIPATTPTSNSFALRLYATTAAIPLANELAAAYRQVNPAFTFDVVTGNYQATVERMLQGQTPYFLSNHLPVDSLLWAAPIGQDGIAIIVHPDNMVHGLTTEQLRAIYQGNISNWSEVGGTDGSITVISREDGSGTRAEFERLVMGERHTTSGAQIAPSSKAMMTAVARKPGSIGYVSMSYLDTSVRPLVIDGIDPTLENVARNRYPLRATLFVIGLFEPEDDYRRLIGWIQSPDGQAVVARHYAPLLVTTP